MDIKEASLDIIKKKEKREKLDILIHLAEFAKRNISLEYENLICEEEFPYINVIEEKEVSDQESILAYKCVIRFLLISYYSINCLKSRNSKINIAEKKYYLKALKENTLDDITAELIKERDMYDKTAGKGYKVGVRIQKILAFIGWIITICITVQAVCVLIGLLLLYCFA